MSVLQWYIFPWGISSFSTHLTFFIFPNSSSRGQKKVQQRLSKHAVKIGTSTMAPSVAGYLAALIHNIIKLWQMAAAPQGIQLALRAYECDINRNVRIIRNNAGVTVYIHTRSGTVSHTRVRLFCLFAFWCVTLQEPRGEGSGLN